MDYSHYTTAELLESLNTIDKAAYPENYAKLVAELETRKPEIEAQKKQDFEQFTFSTENRLKVLSWLQIATAIGFAIAFVNVLMNSMDSVDLAVYATIAIFNGLAGYRLFHRLRFGYELSYVNQILQIVTVNLGFFFYSYTGLGSLLVGIEDGIFFRVNLLSTDFRLYFVQNLGHLGIGIDLLALFFLGVLHSCKDLGLDKKTVEQAQSAPDDRAD